jgi:pimeloyl-ACP methyl ester carboxylesterase
LKVVVSALAVGALVLGTGVASAQAEPSLTWKPCEEDTTVECTTLSLPVDWAEPGGDEFGLAVDRRRATDPAHRIGVLLVNPGGPGGSGVDFTITDAPTWFSPEILARFDIIGFDPRGVARSQPVKCSLDLLERAPSLYPTSHAEFDTMARYARRLHDDCREQSGPIVDHADSVSVAHDMDALRQALGEQKISYYGVSYGTLLGQMYAEHHGDHLRAMTIDSNMDHSLSTIPFVTKSAAGVEDSFREFAKWCDRTTGCALHGRNVPKLWDGLLAKADRGELTDPDDPNTKVGSLDLIGGAGGTFYAPNWSVLATMISSLDTNKPTRQAFADDFAVEDPFRSVLCQDYSVPVPTYDDYKLTNTLENAVSPHMRGGILGHQAWAACVGWTDHVTNPPHRLDLRAAPKILMINARHDPATSHAWASDVHRQTGDRTVLVTYDGWGHAVYPHTDCTRGVVDKYLVEGTVPKDGTHCAAVEPSSRSFGRTPKVIVPRW